MTDTDFTTPDAVRVISVGLFRLLNRATVGRQGIGSLPWNGTEGELREEDAISLFDDCPGLRFVVEAGLRSLEGDADWQAWLTSLWAGSRDECATAEQKLAARLAPDEEAWAAFR